MFYGFDLLLEKNGKRITKRFLKLDFNLLLCLQLMFPHLDSI